MSEPPLIAIVDTTETDRAVRELKSQGCYDSDRRIRQTDSGDVALPVTEPPDKTEVRDVRRDANPDYRIRDLDDRLRERGFTDEERANAPRSWAVLGTVILAEFEGCPRESEVADALLDLHGEADTVVAREGIVGEYREPQVRVVAGEGDTETIHREHGTAYAMDLAEVMFSPGNKSERIRMGELVTPGEDVFDMFAGIGYFTLPMARNGAAVTATEHNPRAFRYLLENSVLNEVSERIDAFRADCRTVRPRADRVVMGHYDAVQYLPAAVDALRPGGTLHLHDVDHADDPFANAVNELEQLTGSLEIQDRRVVKTHSPGMVHVVLDVAYRSD